jgi:choline-sulfatase
MIVTRRPDSSRNHEEHEQRRLRRGIFRGRGCVCRERRGLRDSPRAVAALTLSLTIAACGAADRAPSPHARNLVLITIDTLRADHVGAYGYARGRTPTLDGLAGRGARFDRAYAAAPITLPSHATLLTGRYPPGHGARDNGMRIAASIPTIASTLRAQGFRTAAFVAAFPLDHQFGLDRGFEVYSDRLGRGADGKPANERPASQVVDEAIAWLRTLPAGPNLPSAPAFFLWVHFFEPHAPYGNPSSGRPAMERYDEEIATADREAGRLLTAIGPALADSVIVATGDHGEAFGEHGEYAHSIFVYDTTLRVPLIIVPPQTASRRGTGDFAARVVGDPVTLADIAPTVMRMLGGGMADVDGIDLGPALAGRALPVRELYAESFAPLVEFGWAPLRAIRSGAWKYIAAPRPELYDLAHDPAEQHDVAAAQTDVVRRLADTAGRYSAAALSARADAANPQAAERLRALGYAGSRPVDPGSGHPDPKDRRELAARIAQVTSGELTGDALVAALEGIVRDDPGNAQAHLRLGYARLQAGDCPRAEPEFRAAATLPSADAFLGLASCLGARRDLAGAERALAEARRRDPDNPVVLANQGILEAAQGNTSAAIGTLRSALAADPDLNEARFNLALAYARAGRRAEAAATARDLLARLPSDAPQRPEVERLVKSLR